MMVQYQYCQSVLTQITAYNRLREEDLNELRASGIIDDENDLSSPTGLWKVVHDQALDDGYINELTSILKNLITIPASGDILWNNIAKIVQAALEPTQSKYKAQPMGLPAPGGLPRIGQISEEDKKDATYLSYDQLQHLLKVQAAEEEKEKEDRKKNDEAAIKLEEERKKVNELEEQVQHLQKKTQQMQLDEKKVEEEQKKSEQLNQHILKLEAQIKELEARPPTVISAGMLHIYIIHFLIQYYGI